MTTALRIQLRRSKGWRIPPGTVKVDRSTRWGNPWVIGLVACACRSSGECNHNAFRAADQAEAVEAYSGWLAVWCARAMARARDVLRGKNLACWCRLCPAHAAGKPAGVACPDCDPCHVDPLIVAVNADPSSPHTGDLHDGRS